MLVGGLALSLALFVAIRGWERRELDAKASELVHEQVARLEVTVLRSMEVLHSVAAWHAAQPGMTREEFRSFVGQALLRQPELQALSWNPVVLASQRAEFERAARTEGVADFEFKEKDSTGHLIRAGSRPDFVPVYFIEPRDSNAAALGFDLGSDPMRRETFERARDTGLPTATAPVLLAQGSEHQPGFLVLLPVYHGPTPKILAERRARIAGFAVAVFRADHLVGRTLSGLQDRGIDVRLFDAAASANQVLLASDGFDALKDSQPATAHVEVAGRKWSLAYAPSTRFVAAESRHQSWLVLCAGLAFTLLTTAYVYGGWRRASDVAAANAALREEVIVRQKAESAAAAANAAKSDFLASMNHEIRTPLNAILGYAQIMQRDPHLQPEQRDMIRSISGSGQHLLGLINEILDLAKIEAGRMELKTVDFKLGMLGRSLAATFQPMCVRKKIGFRLEMAGAMQARVRGDEGKLRQVLINLLGNAVKFTHAGEVYLQFRDEGGGRWLFEVIDTGLGIPVEEQADIFKPFHQGTSAENHGGTGLGLAIARQQVELLGGSLQLQSERGIGSRFYFNIPLEKTDGVAGEMPREVSRLASGSTVRAMVVDDRADNRNVLTGMLSAVGCSVIPAVDGEEAFRLVETERPQIVFLDLLLPGWGGIETARRVCALPPDRRPVIIAHTASLVSLHRDEAMAAGCAGFLDKPFRAEQLYECLQAHLGVSFDYFSSTPEAESGPGQDCVSVVLPDDLCVRLTVAAELHSTTALKACLQELRELGSDEGALAERIRLLMRSYDMDGILQLLARVTESNAPRSGT